MTSTKLPVCIACVTLALAGSAARADTELAIRFPWDATSLSGGEAFGLGGIGLDAGVRVAQRWYLGAIVDLEAVMHTSPATTDNPAGLNVVDRQRVGGELRYYTGDLATPNALFSGQHWIGLRYGAETVDDRATVGRFADITYARDSAMGAGLVMGWYVSAGVSLETVSAWNGSRSPAATPAITGTSPSTSGGSTEAAPYLAIGMRLGFR